MGRRFPSHTAVSLLAGALALAFGPGVASAHEVAGSRFETPIPLSLLFAGAGAAVALTAVWLAVTGRTHGPTERRRLLVTLPPSVATTLRYVASGLFLAAVVAVLAAGRTGRQVAAENVATVFTWAVWFHGLALVAVLFGTPWPTLSPWRTVYRGLVRLEGKSLALLGEYPSRLGAWPAVLAFVVLLGIVENLTVIPRSPRLTTVVVAVYAAAMLTGAVLYGTSWFRRADPLGVLYRLFGRVAPVSVSRTDAGGYDISVRPPWQGCLTPVAGTALVVFVVATVYTVSFDGFTETRLFQEVLFGTRDALGTGPGTSALLYLAGFAAFVGVFLCGCWLVERLGAGAGREWLAAARWFAPTVLPIAAAYDVAHNYTFVLRNAGRLVGFVVPGVGPVDPLTWLSVPFFWGSQVVLVVLGHVVAVAAAHYVAFDRYDSQAAARRGHLPLVVLMVGYTVLSLWIISQPLVS